ncbi:ATP-binding protein [Haloferula sp.]|uniref:ATP-binding protein n=1 Tax=Haloferula sp. TaxID=2497595 RepID=UPI003C752B16
MNEIEESIRDFKVTVLLGPRGIGKRALVEGLEVAEENYFNLEDAMDQARFENPREALGGLRNLVLVEGLHRQGECFRDLLDLVTSWGGPSRLLILANVSPALMKGGTEVAHGKVNFIEVGGLSDRHLAKGDQERLWLRGGFSGSFFSDTDEKSVRWREVFVQTLLRRDLPAVGIDVPAERMLRFWTAVARRHGEAWNGSLIAADSGISHPTARSYLDVLTGAFMLRQLLPFPVGGTKRVVKAPKVFLRDSGLLHSLLEIESLDALRADPIHEASWKGFVLEQLVSGLGLEPDEMFFWATHGGAGLDLVVEREGKRFGFEFKLTDEPRVTHSMTIAKADLGLEKVWLVHPGESSFPLRDGMEALGMAGSLDRTTLSR